MVTVGRDVLGIISVVGRGALLIDHGDHTTPLIEQRFLLLFDMAVYVSGFRAVSNDLDLFREQLQDGLTAKKQLNTVTLHLNMLKLKWQVWLCDTGSAIGNGKNVSGLQNTVKLQLGKYEWMSEGMTSKKKQLVELLEKQCFICVEIRPFNGLGSRYKVALKIRSEKMEGTLKHSLVEEGVEILNVMSGISMTDGCGIRRKYTCWRAAEALTKSLARQRALNSWLKILTHAADQSKQLDLEKYSKKCYL
ncbi:hypothetical protein T07_9470 [Trichinella nelsoni]|uniref:Uncharacterized protein n=1 Tax=Trichinella nelsoni TaxID=6336 RepID=A0A0V0RT67_9BILA|nr:hypothetical protein T07_9470 [Trichinella nelsoni]